MLRDTTRETLMLYRTSQFREQSDIEVRSKDLMEGTDLLTSEEAVWHPDFASVSHELDLAVRAVCSIYPHPGSTEAESRIVTCLPQADLELPGTQNLNTKHLSRLDRFLL